MSSVSIIKVQYVFLDCRHCFCVGLQCKDLNVLSSGQLVSFLSCRCFDFFIVLGVCFLDLTLLLLDSPHPPPPKSLHAPHLALNDSLLLLFLSKSKELGEKAVLPSQSTTLISLRCITLQKPCIPHTHPFVFFPAVTLSIDCLCF